MVTTTQMWDALCGAIGHPEWSLDPRFVTAEARAAQVKQWFIDDESCGRLPRPLAEVHAEVDAGIEVWQEHGRELCSAFLAEAAS